MKLFKIVETKKSWLFVDQNGNYLTETNMFGGSELVELYKEDYGFDLMAAEFVEKHYGVEVCQYFENEIQFNF